MLQPVGKMFVAFAGYLLSFALQIPNGVRGHAHKGGPTNSFNNSDEKKQQQQKESKKLDWKWNFKLIPSKAREVF